MQRRRCGNARRRFCAFVTGNAGPNGGALHLFVQTHRKDGRDDWRLSAKCDKLNAEVLCAARAERQDVYKRQAVGGPIALVEEGDLIRIDVPNRQLAIVGVNGEEKTPEEMEAILAQRRANWKPKAPKYTKGLLKLYSQHAVSPMKGAYME